MISKRSTRSLWSYLVSFLLLTIICSLLFGGVQLYIQYRNIVDSGLRFNKTTLHFFTKEYIQRRYLGLTVKKQPEHSEFPSFRIFADEKDIESLNSDLPASAKTRFVPGHIQVDAPHLSSGIEFRYRGGLPLHWLYKKKSLRVKLPPYITYKGERQFNLVNPSTAHTITDWISYDMSRSLGLLTPEYFPARVFINNESNGLHFFLSRVDESFLRKNHRMPGSIYSGDTVYVPNPFGPDVTAYETVFNKDGLPQIWKDERLWDKGASRNTESKGDRRDIKKFIEIINQTSPYEFMESFDTYFDKEKFYLYWGLDTLLGTYHHDLFHNHKMYFDPYKGKFEPIEWDIRFWSNIHVKDIVIYPTLKKVILNPILEHERDLVMQKVMTEFPVENVIKKIEQANVRIKDEIAADPMRQTPDHRYGLFVLDKTVPFSLQVYDDAIDELKLSYESRHTYIQKVLDYSKAGYTLVESGVNQLLLTVSVTGNSAIEFNPWEIVPKAQHSKINIFRYYKNSETAKPVSSEKSELLYPGRLISKGNVFNRTDSRSILTFGKEKLLWSPLHYQFLIKGTDLISIGDLGEVNGRNAITGNSIQLYPVDELPSDSETASVHPWYLKQDQFKDIPSEIVLSGEINIMEDQIYSKRQTVRILPGTVINLAKDKSLVFYGKVLAQGTHGSPIEFKQLKKGEPWGSLVIQGKAASGSQLQYIHVSNGSVTTQRLIDYPGQLNIHDVDSFYLAHSLIQSNHIGDDALHVAYSNGEIHNCRFKNTAFDALDMDISEVTVSGSKFVNIGNDALDLMTSKITIKDVSIVGAGDKCVSVGEESEVTIKKSRLHQCHIGIAVKDHSKAYVEDVDFHAIKQEVITLYQKNPRYGLGGTIDGRRLSGITEEDIHLDSGSNSLIPKEAFIVLSESVSKASD